MNSSHKKIPGNKRVFSLKEFSRASVQLFLRIDSSGCRSVFFPEVGALPIYYTMQKYRSLRWSVFSSKVTALKKSSLHRQIIGVLSVQERSSRLSLKERLDFLETWRDLAPSLSGISDTPEILARKTREEIITEIGDIGISLPTETEVGQFLDQISFNHFRASQIDRIVKGFSSIAHISRPLLNIVLGRTRLARKLRLGEIYVVDEAISRGRTLNVLELIFRAFFDEAKWRIGVLFAPPYVHRSGVIDFIYSHTRTSPFTNKFDSIGVVVVKNKNSFSRILLDDMEERVGVLIPDNDPKRVKRFLKDFRPFIRDELSRLNSVCNEPLLKEKDLKRLYLFWLTCTDPGIIKSCIDLDPIETMNLVEEIDFYVGLPHPFLPLVFRDAYRDHMLFALKDIENATGARKRTLEKIQKDFSSVQTAYEYDRLRVWRRKRERIWLKIENHLKDL